MQSSERRKDMVQISEEIPSFFSEACSFCLTGSVSLVLPFQGLTEVLALDEGCARFGVSLTWSGANL